MADFTLDTSTLSGGQFQTMPFDMDGEFRDIQFRFSQAGSAQDMELHYLELHYTLGGVSKENI